MMKRLNRNLAVVAFLVMMAAIMLAFRPKPTTIFLAGDSTMSIKETKAYPETGWGMPFAFFWDNAVQVVNKAKNGRSTKTFISEGIWQSITDAMGPGDYVFIQFGHNDESKEKVERYTTPDEYKQNLERFVTETRQKQGIPVLLTPVSRRRFDKDGKALETHADYSPLVKEVAAKTKTTLIDLDSLSIDLYQQFGAEHSKMLFLQLKPREHPNYPDGKEDNTHFNELGARLIAQLVMQQIRIQIPALASHLVVPVKK
jgi:lysophospholipase L1-like esterase